MKFNFISIIFLLISLQSISQVQNYIIQLNVDLKPYINARDIEAQVYINHTLRTSLKADNSAFAKIFGQVPKEANDSVVEIQIVVNSPVDYIALENQMPFRYFPGTGRRIIVASKPWLKEHGLAYAKAVSKNSPDTSSNLVAAILNEDLFKNTSQEIELTKLLAENYAAIGDYAQSYYSLASISNNKIKVLPLNQQANYFAELFGKFKLLATKDTSQSYNMTAIAKAISQNDTTYKIWKLLISKVFAVPVGKNIDVKLFKVPTENESVLDAQVLELATKLDTSNDNKQRTVPAKK